MARWSENNNTALHNAKYKEVIAASNALLIERYRHDFALSAVVYDELTSILWMMQQCLLSSAADLDPAVLLSNLSIADRIDPLEVPSQIWDGLQERVRREGQVAMLRLSLLPELAKGGAVPKHLRSVLNLEEVKPLSERTTPSGRPREEHEVLLRDTVSQIIAEATELCVTRCRAAVVEGAVRYQLPLLRREMGRSVEAERGFGVHAMRQAAASKQGTGESASLASTASTSSELKPPIPELCEPADEGSYGHGKRDPMPPPPPPQPGPAGDPLMSPANERASSPLSDTCHAAATSVPDAVAKILKSLTDPAVAAAAIGQLLSDHAAAGPAAAQEQERVLLALIAAAGASQPHPLRCHLTRAGVSGSVAAFTRSPLCACYQPFSALLLNNGERCVRKALDDGEKAAAAAGLPLGADPATDATSERRDAICCRLAHHAEMQAALAAATAAAAAGAPSDHAIVIVVSRPMCANCTNAMPTVATNLGRSIIVLAAGDKIVHVFG